MIAVARRSCKHAAGNSVIMAHLAPLHMTITHLPTDVLSCIVSHLQQDALHLDQQLDDVAALRSVCRFLRLAVDLVVMTHATLHSNAGAAELSDIARRSQGDKMCMACWTWMWSATDGRAASEQQACSMWTSCASASRRKMRLKFLLLWSCRPAHCQAAKASRLCCNIDVRGACKHAEASQP